jgi:hypothetical protein
LKTGYEVRDESIVESDDITNVAMLMKALKVAFLDREKLDTVGEFVHRCDDDELVYLEQKVSTSTQLLPKCLIQKPASC